MSDTSDILEEFFNSRNIIVLTGAGISAESGLPTFRDKDGYWTKGSKNYHPMELARNSAFKEEPAVVWEWYHYRRNLYAKTEPNKGHYALVELEKLFKEKNKEFHLVTQNVDGLHRKAGSKPESMFEIHGNIFFMRCFKECTNELVPIKNSETGVPICQHCGSPMRPHVLWMDEFYDEDYYKFTTVAHLGDEMDALMIVGTTLQTNLPYQLVNLAYYKKVPTIAINLESLGLDQYGMLELQGKSGEILPGIISKLSND